jgi:hypothetical protein
MKLVVSGSTVAPDGGCFGKPRQPAGKRCNSNGQHEAEPVLWPAHEVS